MTRPAIRIVLHLRLCGPYDDDAIHISLRDRFVERNGLRLQLDRTARSLLVAFCCHSGRIFRTDDLVDIAFGDCPWGGPDAAKKSIDIAIMDLRVAAPALGLVLTRGNDFACVRAGSFAEAAE